MTATVLFTSCPPWCVSDDCNGDHWAAPGSNAWPGVVATAYPAGGDRELTAFPTWGAIDGLRPAVALWLQGEADTTIDMTPQEAVRLAAQILRAVEAVQ